MLQKINKFSNKIKLIESSFNDFNPEYFNSAAIAKVNYSENIKLGNNTKVYSFGIQTFQCILSKNKLLPVKVSFFIVN